MQPAVEAGFFFAALIGELDEPRRWTWEEFQALPNEDITVDIHCVTKSSKLDTVWRGVSVDTLLDRIETAAKHVIRCADGGYTTAATRGLAARVGR